MAAQKQEKRSSKNENLSGWELPRLVPTF